MLNRFITKTSTNLLACFIMMTIVGPFIAANNLNRNGPFFLFIISVTLISSLLKNKWLQLPLICSSFIATLYFYFPLLNSSDQSWFFRITIKIKQSIAMVINGNAGYFPEILALIIFLAITLLFLRLFINYQHWLTQYFFCLGYLLTLAAVNYTIVSKEIILLTSFSLLFAYLQQALELPLKPFLMKISIGVLLVLLASSLAWLTPEKPLTVHRRLVTETGSLRRYLQQNNFYTVLRRGRGGSIGKTGFSEDDSSLGGPVLSDNSLVFTAKQKNSHYWRIDSKDYYSGSGWSNAAYSSISFTESPMIIGDNYSKYSDDTINVELSPEKSISYLPIPYGKVTWEIDPENTLQSFPEINYVPSNQRVATKLFNYNAFSTVNYTYQPPDYTIGELQQTTAQKKGDEALYLQLPATLPERIIKLAQEITIDSKNDYERVKKIEAYLKFQGDFTYSLSDAESLPEGHDYVDFFLFDSQVGYCEHFASSMVVLLRSLDIHARWAKGFAPGTLASQTSDGLQTYEIRNKDAHVWPEVYFEGIGWVPFEPTRSFNNPEQDQLLTNFNTENQTPTPDGTNNRSDQPTEPNHSNNAAQDKSQKKATTPKGTTKSSFNFKKFFTSYKWLIAGSVLSVLVIIWFLRDFICWNLLYLRWSFFKQSNFQKAYQQLLASLTRLVPRKNNLSLQNYLLELTEVRSDWQPSMENLTTLYQEDFYGHSQSKTLDDNCRQDFLLVIKIAKKQQLKKLLQQLKIKK